MALDLDTLNGQPAQLSRPNSAAHSIPRRAADAGLAPLSFAQQRIWFLERLRPGTPVYNIPLAIRLQGPLDLRALERSLNEIVRRHEALRTTFPEIDGRPVQVVREAVELPLTVERLKPGLRRSSSPGSLEVYTRLLAEAEVRKAFDLATGPLVRARLLRLSGRNHVLLLTLHHIVFDGWSAAVFMYELGVLYEVFASSGEHPPSPLLELPIQYPDFAAWQRGWLSDEQLAPELAYWRQRLSGMTELQLPSDRPRSEEGAHSGARQQLDIPGPLADRLKALARQERMTLYMVLLAAFQALLARYTGQEDIAIGSPIAGRTRTETEGLIGFFVNTLVLRTDCSGDPTFRDLLGRVREVALGAYAHQEAPFERLVAELQPERYPGRTPLVSVTFALQHAPRSSFAWQGLKVTHVPIGTETAKFDLSLELREIDDKLQGSIEYSTALFDAATIERLAGHFRMLLAGAVAAPDKPLSKLPLLTPAERHRLLAEWNTTAADFPRDHCIHELFETQVKSSPDAVAVIFDNEQLTYREINSRANKLAHHLRRLGVGPEVVVGLCLERSAAMIVGMLGTLKAGGAYLPLDPSDPLARRDTLLADARARVLVTQGGQVSESEVRVVRLDADAAALASEADTDPALEVTATSLAYVIYTSGSTGEPKGVAVPHRAVVRLVVGVDFVSLGPGDVVAQAANATFDAATFEVWGALLNGARLVMLPREVVLSPPALTDELAQRGVTTLFLTTALFNLLVREAPAALHGVRQVLFGGEAADPGAVAALLQHGPPERLLHVYGPTETTTFATWHRVEGLEPGATTIPIGRPIANTTCYVLDRHRRLLPIGVPGELYIGGPGVARGYLHRPELTNERFVPDPFSADPHARRYRTGDLVRWRPDGSLEFLGRLDEQVKIRGFRVEPGEVAAALRRHPALREVAVAGREVASDDKRLVAYVVPIAEPAPTPSELRDFLKATVPDFMVPSVFVTLEALPLTPAGKVDYGALPLPGQWGAAEDRYVAPRTPTEEALAGIWSDLLGGNRVGIHDDFFEVGGHSLLVAQVIARLRDEVGVELPVRALFEAPTVAELAGRVESARAPDTAGDGPPQMTSRAMVPLQATGTRWPLFLVPGGQGQAANLFKLAQLARRLGSDQPCYGFLVGDVEPGRRDIQGWVEAVAAGFITELRARQPEGPYLLGGTCVGGILAFEMAQQLLAQDQQVAGLFLLDTHLPGDNAEATLGLWLQRRDEARALRRAGFSAGAPSEGADSGTRDIDSSAEGSNRAAVTGSTVRAPSAGATNALHDMIGPHWLGLRLYRYRPRPYQGRITFFVNEEWHRQTHPVEWEEVTGASVEVEVIPGDHRTYLIEHLDVVADRLRAHLDTLQSPAAGNSA